MVSLPQIRNPESNHSGGCGTHCGNGLEKIYPTTAVRYGAMNWIGEFSYKPGSAFKCGGKVVIQTDRGIELGQQVSLSCNGCSKSVSREQIRRYIDNSGPEFYRLGAGQILREATAQDLMEHERLNACLREDIDRCALLAAQLGLEMKVVTAEHLLGGERIVFYFRSEGRIDFRALVRELAHHYQTRIELRQVGARDEARLVADYEICGRECCCKNFLKKLRPVTMKMAKMQKSTLDPSKVSGRCGRLRCCLRYEHEGYESLARKLPRLNSWAQTAYGIAKVVDRQVLTQLVLVRLSDGREVTIPVEEISACNLAPPPDAERFDRPERPTRESRPGRGQREDRPVPDAPRVDAWDHPFDHAGSPADEEDTQILSDDDVDAAGRPQRPVAGLSDDPGGHSPRRRRGRRGNWRDRPRGDQDGNTVPPTDT